MPAPVFVPPTPATAAPTAVKPGVPSSPDQINSAVPGNQLGLKPIESPLLPISASQHAQLDALLAKYKANEITPEEYHKQRAAILTQPQQ